MRDALIGNAIAGSRRGGWLVGKFIPIENLRHTKKLAVKFSNHKAGESRGDWSSAGLKLLCILAYGKFCFEFRKKGKTAIHRAVLAKSGDYCLLSPKFEHRWTALERCVTVSVKWAEET